MEVAIIVREEESVGAVQLILDTYGVDYDEKGPYLGGVAAHFNARNLPEEARQELLPIPGVMIMPKEA
jgi:hypothetical protein